MASMCPTPAASTSSGMRLSSSECTTAHAACVNSGALTSVHASRQTGQVTSGAVLQYSQRRLPLQRRPSRLYSPAPGPKGDGPRRDVLVATCTRTKVSSANCDGRKSMSLSTIHTCVKPAVALGPSNRVHHNSLKPGTVAIVAHGGGNGNGMLWEASKTLSSARTHACVSQVSLTACMTRPRCRCDTALASSSWNGMRLRLGRLWEERATVPRDA